MNRAVKLALALAASAVVAHIGAVWATPYALMRVAMDRLSGEGKAINGFAYGPRTTQKSRGVVRPSPDLAYSSCVYDLAGGPLLVTADPSPNQGYVSLSVFAANTDNIGVFDSLRLPGGIRFVLALDGQEVPKGERVLRSPSRSGIILDRRLAPDAATFTAVDRARRQDSCRPFKGEVAGVPAGKGAVVTPAASVSNPPSPG